MFEEGPLCPECGYELTGIRIRKHKKTKEIAVEFFCDEAGDDTFRFQILTGLTDKDLSELKTVGEIIPKKWQ